MKTNRTQKNLVAILVLSAFLFYKFSSTAALIPEEKSKPFLTVNNAKMKAFQIKSVEAAVMVKGIYTVQQNSAKGYLLQLEDAEPTGMEDVPFYCLFTQESKSYLTELTPGTELTISGLLSRNNNSVLVTDCKIICINKGTVEPQGFTFKN